MRLTPFLERAAALASDSKAAPGWTYRSVGKPLR